MDVLPVASFAIRCFGGIFAAALLLALITALAGVITALSPKGHWLPRWRWFRLSLASFGAAVLFFATASGTYYGVYLPTLGARQREKIEKIGTLTAAGDMAPDVSFTTLDGEQVSLRGKRGNVVLVNFFATWCGPCLMELPELESLWREFRDKEGFRMWVIGREETVESVKAFQKEHGFTFPMAADPERAVYRHFATERIPRTYLIARDGAIAYQFTGNQPDELEHVRRLLRRQLAK